MCIIYIYTYLYIHIHICACHTGSSVIGRHSTPPQGLILDGFVTFAADHLAALLNLQRLSHKCSKVKGKLQVLKVYKVYKEEHRIGLELGMVRL